MGKFLTLGCKVKPGEVPKIWSISETGRANILKRYEDFPTTDLLDTIRTGYLIIILQPLERLVDQPFEHFMDVEQQIVRAGTYHFHNHFCISESSNKPLYLLT